MADAAESTAPGASSTRSLADGVVLPNISPLTDKEKIKPTVAHEHIAEGLEDRGYAVGWDGGIRVSATASLDWPSFQRTGTFGGRTATGRPRTSGFLSFSRSKPDGQRSSRPCTSASMGSTASAPSSPTGSRMGLRSQTSGGSRFAHITSFETSAPEQQQQQPGVRPGSRHASNGSLTQSLPNGIPASGQLARALMEHKDHRLDIPMANLKDLERPGTGMLTSCTGRTVIDASPKSGMRGTAHPSSAFKATRGHALCVFNEMDKDKDGKITMSVFEDAALALGFSLEQAHAMFRKLDKRGRGFLEATDWGSKDFSQQIQVFSTRYMQKYMGVPDISTTPEQVRKFWRAQEISQVKSLAAAINLVRANAIARGARSASGSGDAVYDVFRFIDLDGSGDLNKDELCDAFYALGVFLSDKVIQEIMRVFDNDNSGSVQYHEFVSTMFPKALSG